MKIYTKTGDDGTTGLQGGKRVSKSNERIKAYGSVDEINSILGIILSHNIDEDIRKLLIRIQSELFILGSDLSNPNLNDKKNRITSNMIKDLEDKIDEFEKELSPLSNFILPGGSHTCSLTHFARTISRRAELNVVSLSEKEKINKECQIYLNRLSDILFVVARILNKRSGTLDIIWDSKKDTL
jgi:cob(I)alamin adenosyltransferase